MSELIKKMVDRFLGWELPKTMQPDCGIEFNRMVNIIRNGHVMPTDRSEAGTGSWPVGTNLFDANEAQQMIDYICVPVFEEITRQQAEIERMRGALQKIFDHFLRGQTETDTWWAYQQIIDEAKEALKDNQ